MRISDWSSDVCSSDLIPAAAHRRRPARRELPPGPRGASRGAGGGLRRTDLGPDPRRRRGPPGRHRRAPGRRPADRGQDAQAPGEGRLCGAERSEEHTSELQSLMRISYAVLCLKKKITKVTYIMT